MEISRLVIRHCNACMRWTHWLHLPQIGGEPRDPFQVAYSGAASTRMPLRVILFRIFDLAWSHFIFKPRITTIEHNCTQYLVPKLGYGSSNPLPSSRPQTIPPTSYSDHTSAPSGALLALPLSPIHHTLPQAPRHALEKGGKASTISLSSYLSSHIPSSAGLKRGERLEI